MKYLRNTLIGLSSICVLVSCTPTYEDTQQRCLAFLPTSQTTASSNYLVEANSASGSYKLYLEDFLNSFKEIQSKSVDGGGNVTLADLSTDEQAAIDFIFDRLQNHLNYELNANEEVVSANNPLDYMESLIATVDNNLIVQAFAEAKTQMATAIARNDGHCTYSNRQIAFFREDTDRTLLDSFQAQLDLTYVPSAFVEGENKVDQTVLLTLDRDPDPSIKDQVSFSAIDRIAPENFKAVGYSETKVRQISVKEFNSPENLIVDEDYLVTKTGTMAYSQLNAACLNETNTQVVTCPIGTTTKPVEHENCSDGIDEDGAAYTSPDVADETDTVEVNQFTIPGSSATELADLQRLKVEVDYPNNEIRIYVSKFGDAIYKALDDSDNPIPQGIDNPNPTDDQLIFNPTNCESYNVSRDLFALQPEGSINSTPATIYQDPGFDLIQQRDGEGNLVYDDDNNPVYIDPTPIFVFQGTAIPARQ